MDLVSHWQTVLGLLHVPLTLVWLLQEYTVYAYRIRPHSDGTRRQLAGALQQFNSTLELSVCGITTLDGSASAS
eukprot:358706-Chlamydomonas_euryale.AAC.5